MMSSVKNKKLTELNNIDYRASTWSDIFLLKDQLTEEENMISETAASYAQDKLMTRVLAVSYTHLTLPTKRIV